MEDNKIQVPFIVYESAQSKSERIIKRLIIALVLSIILIFASNALWLWAWMQYDYTYETTEYSQDGTGVNIIGDRNGVLNIESESEEDEGYQNQAERNQ